MLQYIGAIFIAGTKLSFNIGVNLKKTMFSIHYTSEIQIPLRRDMK